MFGLRTAVVKEVGIDNTVPITSRMISLRDHLLTLCRALDLLSLGCSETLIPLIRPAGGCHFTLTLNNPAVSTIYDRPGLRFHHRPARCLRPLPMTSTLFSNLVICF